ncbi:hypothetical protein DFH06DRAFT_289562 [Mycena polygramma]|nr:hypothetical protein DFH06DRAFT_289562 [Mycena polygramma]
MATTSALRKRLVELDTQIVEHKRILRGLEQTRTAVERELHDTATFPVITLPAEITAEIFLQCLTWCAYTSHGFGAFTGVCRGWRGIAFATPRLWSTLDLPHLPLQTGLVEGHIDRWFARAGVLPLSLGVKLPDYLPTDKIFPLDRLRDIIQRYSHRVQCLELRLGDRDFHKLGLDLAEFPLLQRAMLSCYDPDLFSGVDPPPKVFCNAPRLHDLNLQLLSTEVDLDRFILPWLQLTKFEGTIPTLDLFTLAPNLVEVKCDFRHDDDLVLPTTLPLLSSLTVIEASLNIIHYLTLPALKHLHIHEMDTEYYDSLEPFLMRSSPPLESLSVRADHGCYERWRICLPRVDSTLENLQIFSASEQVMLDLSSRWNSWSLDYLPNLRTVILEDVACSVNFYWLIDLLYSRSDKLRSFRLVWTDDPFLDGTHAAGPQGRRTEDTISGHLSQISRAGMDVYLGTNDKNYAASTAAIEA